MAQPTTTALASRLAELAEMITTANLDRPPAVVVLRTLLRYVGEHGSVCESAKHIAAAFDANLESGAIRLAGPLEHGGTL